MKLSSAILGYWLDKKIEFKPKTVVSYSHIFDLLTAFVGDIDIDKITSNDVRRFLVHLADTRKLSKRSLYDAWVPLSSLWTWAEKELTIPHIIRGKVESPDFPDPMIEPFTRDEIKKLVAAVDETREWKTKAGKTVTSKRPTALRDRAIILTLLDCGIRAQELCDLVIKDYEQVRGRLHIRHGKNDKARFVYLGARARKALWRYLAERTGTKPTHPLFATKTGEHMQRDNLRHTLQNIAAQAGVANVYTHRFRHTMAIEFLRNGGSVVVLKEILGHESLETVLVYVRLAELDLEKAPNHSPADNWRL